MSSFIEISFWLKRYRVTRNRC